MDNSKLEQKISEIKQLENMKNFDLAFSKIGMLKAKLYASKSEIPEEITELEKKYK